MTETITTIFDVSPFTVEDVIAALPKSEGPYSVDIVQDHRDGDTVVSIDASRDRNISFVVKVGSPSLASIGALLEPVRYAFEQTA